MKIDFLNINFQSFIFEFINSLITQLTQFIISVGFRTVRSY
jgi:hypothetical protein